MQGVRGGGHATVRTAPAERNARPALLLTRAPGGHAATCCCCRGGVAATPPRGRVARITVCTPTSTATRRRRCAFLSLSDRQNISPVRASERVYLEQSMLHLYAAGQQPRPIREVAAPSPLTATPPLTGGCCTLPDSTEHPVCRQERWAFRFECACCDRSRHSLLLFYC